MFSIQTQIALRAVLTIAGAAALAVIVAAKTVPVDYKPSSASLHLSEAMAAHTDIGASAVSDAIDRTSTEERR